MSSVRVKLSMKYCQVDHLCKEDGPQKEFKISIKLFQGIKARYARNNLEIQGSIWEVLRQYFTVEFCDDIP